MNHKANLIKPLARAALLRLGLGGLLLASTLLGCTAPTPTPTAPAVTLGPPPTSVATAPVRATDIPTPTTTSNPEDYYAGWAMVAYPQASQAELEAALRRQKEAGANFVWIGHNNPGEVAADKVEPGLSYAVYAASQDPNDPAYADAQAMLAAQHRMLQAARAVGLPAVFPIGYQIHMGRAWNTAYPDALRRYHTGDLLDIYGGGVSAALDAAQYQSDIRRYYAWVHQEFVGPYADVIVMLNLADEPLGGDYGPAAEALFKAQTGLGFAEATPAQVGAFQTQVIARYAAWSAAQWAELAPEMLTTMSLDGAQGRWAYHLPSLQSVMCEMPANFVPTFDAYLHDAPSFNPLTENEVGALSLFARTVGYYSATCDREVWFWTAANRWGLAGDSAAPGGVSDAVANGYLLVMAMRATGGHLRGLGVWNYNVQYQGLYGDADFPPYDREGMFSAVSAVLPEWRKQMAEPSTAQATTLILFSREWAHTFLGETRQAVVGSPVSFGNLLPLARAATPLAVVEALPDLTQTAVDTVIVLDPTPDTVSAADLQQLQMLAAQGGRVVAAPAFADFFINASTFAPLPAAPDTLTAEDWAKLLPEATIPPAGLWLNAPPYYQMIYNLGTEPLTLPDELAWRVFTASGALTPTVVLRPHEVAVVP